MPIFNSLGSNYNLSYVIKSLSNGNLRDTKNLIKILEKRYQGKPILFYKGREALTYALKLLNLPKESKVAISGFTCVAVFNAVRHAGHEPLCLDLEKTGDLNFAPKTLEKVLKSNKNIKAVVAQNTFGYPCDIKGIEKICRERNLILIEDLAHCVGAKYEDGRKAGTVGDFVILSFSQDKIIDAVSGGALIVRNRKYTNIKSPGVIERHPEGVIRDRIYPLETYKIRAAYGYGFGKPYHFFLKKINILSDIMNPKLCDLYALPNWHARLALIQFDNLEKQLEHRRSVAWIYKKLLPKKILFKQVFKTIDSSTNLRFPISVENRAGLVKFLKKRGIYVADIWYRDVAPECPNAVNISKRILNLPTHINVSESDARRIVGLINQWIQES